MPIKTDREYRDISLPFDAPESDKRINTDFYVEGYATTFDQPYVLWEWDGVKYYEIIDREALAEADLSDVIMQYDHHGKVLARNSKPSKSLGFEINAKGFFIFADLSKSVEARNLHEEIINGLVTKMSWAFTVKEEKYNKETRTRTITKIKKVYDVSAVSYPANNDTNISARSFIDGVIETEQQELLERKARSEAQLRKRLILQTYL